MIYKKNIFKILLISILFILGHHYVKNKKQENYCNNYTIYTVVTGNYETSLKTKPNKLNKNTKCILITDNYQLGEKSKKEGWIVKKININSIPYYLSNPELESIFNKKKNVWIQRYLKINPHKIPELQNIKNLIWIDGNIEITNKDVYNFISDNNSLDISLKNHPIRNSIETELRPIQKICKSYYNFDNLIKNMKHDKYPDKRLTETNILGRYNFKSEKMIKFADMWWKSLVKSNCWRDQASFDYCLWKCDINFKAYKLYGTKYKHG